MIKNLLLTSCLIMVSLVYGQYSNDFESGTLTPIVRTGGDLQASAMNANNPVTSGINSSATAFQITLTDTAPAWKWLAINAPGGNYGQTNGTWYKFMFLSVNETNVDIQLEPWFSGVRYKTNTISFTGLNINTWYEVEFNFADAVLVSDGVTAAGAEPGYLSRLDFKFNATGNYDGDLFFIDDIKQNKLETLSTEKVTTINNLAVYPNPTSGKVYIDSQGVTIKSIEVYNVTGSLVSSSSDFTNLNKGVYFMRLLTDSGSITKSIIKQ